MLLNEGILMCLLIEGGYIKLSGAQRNELIFLEKLLCVKKMMFSYLTPTTLGYRCSNTFFF